MAAIRLGPSMVNDSALQRWISLFDVEIQFPSVSLAGRIVHIVCLFVYSVAFPVQCCLAVNHVMHSSQLLFLKRSR